MAVKYFDWDDAKNAKLRAERGIGFEAYRTWRPVVHNGGRAAIVDEELYRFDDAAAGFIDSAALRVAPAHAVPRRDPPAGLVSFVSDAIGPHGFFQPSLY